MKALSAIKTAVKNNLIFVICVAALLIFAAVITTLPAKLSSETKFEFLEDKSGKMSIEQVASDAGFSVIENSNLIAGKSESVWWVRFKTNRAGQDDKMVIVDNPSLEAATIYIPKPGGNGYEIMRSGWGTERSDETRDAFTVFELPADIDNNGYLYISICSPYSLTSSFRLCSETEYQFIRNSGVIFIMVFIGMILAMLIYNISLFIILHELLYFTYSIYIILMILYYIDYLGAFWMIFSEFAVWNYSHGISFAINFLMLLAVTVFTRLLLNVKERFPHRDFSYYFIISICGLSAALAISGHVFFVHRFYTITSLITGVYVSVLALKATKSGIAFARNMVYSFILALLSTVVMYFCLWLGITNRYLLTYFPVFVSWQTTILCSVAVADRVRFIQMEKESTIDLVKETHVKTETVALAAQRTWINKRLLFDAMDTASDLCVTDADKAVEIMLDLSDYLNSNFDFDGQSQFNPIKDELKELETYIRIEKTINNFDFDVEYKVDCSMDFMIPPMILQPLVENSITHSFKEKKDKRKILVDIKDAPDRYLLSVEDNGIGMTAKKIGEILYYARDGEPSKLAKINLHLYKLYGTQLKIKSEINKGTKISFELPKEGENAYEGRNC